MTTTELLPFDKETKNISLIKGVIWSHTEYNIIPRVGHMVDTLKLFLITFSDIITELRARLVGKGFHSP